MKNIIIIAFALVAGIAIGIFATHEHRPARPARLKLEEVLSIKELHLVKHRYQDLFFLHRKNDPKKSIRAVIQVPVTLVSYLDLKKVKLVRHQDTITQIILPRAQVHPPSYDLSRMTVHRTRSFHLHAGTDLYPDVSRYLAATLAQRMDSLNQVAIQNKMMEQAEAEGKEYIKRLLASIGHHHIQVTVEDSPAENQRSFNRTSDSSTPVRSRNFNVGVTQ